MAGKKIWFKGLSSRLWLPVSIEGWVVTVVFVLAIYAIMIMNNVSGGVPFDFSEQWPILVEMIVAVIAFYFVTRGHVDKKY